MTEQWADIDGFPGYRVSTMGRVMSLMRGGERILKQTGDMHGYPKVNLHGPEKQISKKVHVLVSRAFYGQPEDGMECAHKDGDRGNPALTNLIYTTRSGNSLHRRYHGVTPCPVVSMVRAVQARAAARMSPERRAESYAAAGRAKSESGIHRGCKNPAGSKLTECDVIGIYEMHDSGRTGREIAKEFSISSMQTSRILRGIKWRHVYLEQGRAS